MPLRAAVACCGLALLLGGCTVGPKYRKPDIPVPPNWRISAETGKSLADVRWWDFFEDPVLQSLIRTALTENLDLRTAAANILAAQAQVGLNRSQQFPQASAGVSTERQRFPQSGAFPFPAGTASAFNTFGLTGSVSYLLDFWGVYRNATEEARRMLLATEEARRNVIATVVSDVAQSYFQLLMLDRELQVTHQTVASLTDSLQLTQERYNYGVASELDVRQAQTVLETARAEIPALERQITLQEDALSILLGHNPGAIPRGLSLLKQPAPPEVPAGLPSELLTRRPDVRQAADQLAAAYSAVGAARAQFFPQINLTASGGSQTATLTDLATVPSLTYSLIAGLTQPVFTGGRLRSNLQLTKAEQSAALVNYQRVAQQAFREVDDALASYQKYRQQATTQQALVTAAQKAVDLASIRYQGGVDNYLTVLDAQRQLFSGEVALAQTRGAILVSLVQLYQALGGGWQQ